MFSYHRFIQTMPLKYEFELRGRSAVLYKKNLNCGSELYHVLVSQIDSKYEYILRIYIQQDNTKTYRGRETNILKYLNSQTFSDGCSSVVRPVTFKTTFQLNILEYPTYRIEQCALNIKKSILSSCRRQGFGKIKNQFCIFQFLNI